MTASASTADKRNCIIVCEIANEKGKHATGLIVDAVSEVCEIKPEQIEENVVLGAKVRTDYISGIAKVNNQVKILLNIDKVLSAEEVDTIQSAAAQ
jgi:purine-binding chemotaxis protein CheW